MKFVLVNGRTPASRPAVRYVLSRSGRVICENLLLSSPTAITAATSVTARLPPQRSKSMRGRHDNHQRFEVVGCAGANRQNSFTLALPVLPVLPHPNDSALRGRQEIAALRNVDAANVGSGSEAAELIRTMWQHMSASPRKQTMSRPSRQVRFVPKAAVSRCSK
jgi:hypothetical protein